MRESAQHALRSGTDGLHHDRDSVVRKRSDLRHEARGVPRRGPQSGAEDRGGAPDKAARRESRGIGAGRTDGERRRRSRSGCRGPRFEMVGRGAGHAPRHGMPLHHDAESARGSFGRDDGALRRLFRHDRRHGGAAGDEVLLPSRQKAPDGRKRDIGVRRDSGRDRPREGMVRDRHVRDGRGGDRHKGTAQTLRQTCATCARIRATRSSKRHRWATP